HTARDSFTNADLALLAKLPRLGHLDLSLVKTITPEGLAALLDAPALWNLSFRMSHLGPEHVAVLSQMSGLKVLTLDDNDALGDDALAMLAKLPQLKVLTLDGTSLTSGGISALAGHPALESLSLARTQVNDAIFQPLSTIPTLRELSLAKTSVTGEGVAQ